jgi:arylsulfatase A-like enzyme
VPDLTDLSKESEATLEMYGPDVKKPGTFAYNCLLARRMAERGVTFTQLYHRGWDQHGNLPKRLREQCKDTDQPSAALVKDLKQRGLLDDTLVIWGGEFGRTVYSQGKIETAAIITGAITPSGWPAAASSPASATARPTTSATTSRRTPFTFTT